MLDTRRLLVEPHGVGRGGDVFHPEHGIVQARHDFVAADDDHDVPGPEGEGRHAVAGHVEVDELAVFGDGIGARDEEVDQQRFAAPLHLLLDGDLLVQGVEQGDVGGPLNV